MIQKTCTNYSKIISIFLPQIDIYNNNPMCLVGHNLTSEMSGGILEMCFDEKKSIFVHVFLKSPLMLKIDAKIGWFGSSRLWGKNRLDLSRLKSVGQNRLDSTWVSRLDTLVFTKKILKSRFDEIFFGWYKEQKISALKVASIERHVIAV